MTRAVALSLKIFTGLIGLVYQVTWQKYLATSLGSHSEATAAVLASSSGDSPLDTRYSASSPHAWSIEAPPPQSLRDCF